MTRTNKYRGTCKACSNPVSARQGSLSKVGGKWVVHCSQCAENGAPVAVQYDNPAGDNAHDRILSWCRSSSAPKHAGMRGSADASLGNCIVRDVASWGDGRLENGDPNPQVYFAMAGSWPECEEILIERFPRFETWNTATLIKYSNQDFDEAQDRERGSSYTRFSSGAEVFTNRAGRCIDAPCCGCCS